MRRKGYLKLWGKAFEEEVLGNGKVLTWPVKWMKLEGRVATVGEEEWAGAYSIVQLCWTSNNSHYFNNAAGNIIIHKLCICFLHIPVSIA